MNSSDLTGKARRSLRLANYDYAMCGAYFVTLCTHQRRPVFGRVLADEMHLNVYGEMVRDEWLRTSEVRANVVLDDFIVMPDHLHAILLIVENRPDIVGATRRVARAGDDENAGLCDKERATQRVAPTTLAKGTLGAIVGQFKSVATKKINSYRAEKMLAPARVWQRNFHDRVLRDERELNAARRYVLENPLRWENAEFDH